MSEIKNYNVAVTHGNGKAGNIRYYQKGGKTYMRAAHNSYNTNPRTARQMRQRLLMSSKVRLWNILKPALLKCFVKSGAQSDCNIWMKLNNSIGVFYTKQESQEGAVTAMPVQIASANGLQSIVNTYISASRQLKSNISLGSLVINDTTTVGAFTAAILANNPGRFEEGDEIAFISLLQSSWEDIEGNEIPAAAMNYYKIVLKVADTRALSGIVSMDGYHSLDSVLATNTNMPAGCFGWLHTRSVDGSIKTAQSSLCNANAEFYDEWRTDEVFEIAAASYGEVQNLFADPNSNNMGSDAEEEGGGGGTTYAITVAVAEGQSAMGSVSGGGNYANGATAVIAATANTGYHFVQWNDGNTSASRSITVSAAASYTASFAEDEEPTGNVTVTLTSEDITKGKVQINGGEQGATASATVTSGSTVTIKAISVAGYDFLKWSDNNQNYERTLTPTENVSLTAYFEEE